MAEITSPLVVRPPTPDNDFFVGTAVSEFVMLLAGDDYAAMAGGNDLAEGDPGNDTLSGGAGDDVLRGEAGLDWLFSDDDEIDSGTESDTIVGGPGVDSLTGGMGNDDFTIEPGDLTGSTIATPEVITDFMGAGVLGGDEIIWKTGGVQLGVVGPFATAPGEPLNVFVFFDPANPAEQLVLQLPGVTGFTGTGTPMAGQLSQLTGDILFV